MDGRNDIVDSYLWKSIEIELCYVQIYIFRTPTILFMDESNFHDITFSVLVAKKVKVRRINVVPFRRCSFVISCLFDIKKKQSK